MSQSVRNDTGCVTGELSHREQLHGQALRDRLLQIVYDHGSIKTGDIREALGSYEAYSITCGHKDCADPKHRRQHGKRTYWNSDFTPSLRQLAKKGEIVRIPQTRPNEGDTWQAPDYQPPDVEPAESTPVDVEAEMVLLALRGPVPRVSHWKDHKPGVNIHSGLVGRARGRALARLAQAHRAEFERYWLEEQWRCIDTRET